MIWSGETEDQRRRRLEQGYRKFAIIPTQMTCGTWVWLEMYWGARIYSHSGNCWHISFLDKEQIYEHRIGPSTPPPKKG